MATKALTYVDQRASRDFVPAVQAIERERGWREFLIEEDADAIWRKLYAFVCSTFPDRKDDPDHKTQELFITLLTTGQFAIYVERGYSDEEIENDLLSFLRR